MSNHEGMCMQLLLDGMNLVMMISGIAIFGLIGMAYFKNKRKDTGLFTFDKDTDGEIWISEEERNYHIENFGRTKGKTQRNDRLLEQQRKLEEAFQIVPEGVVVEWGITEGVVEFLVKEKPVDFSGQQAQELIVKLNAIARGSAVYSKEGIRETN
ncbi:hypothetical protein [Vibrio anguillarum]|uniref:hypothetical protein n=1 Tax=Vibrio anguillarum TaxID=55601 RepID=UPI000BB4B103|nr:hypothetical protein [Vibrio anguillarum]ATC60227.1 hypothetical protein CMV05_22825 [Vibrio anguillarum]